MIDNDLLAILRCPLTSKPLRKVDETLIEQVNQAIKRGEARDRLDQKVIESIDSGVVAEGEMAIYPVRGGILCMVADESIRIEGLVRD